MLRGLTAYRSRLFVRIGWGASVIEFALWGALVAVVIIAGALFFG